MYIAEKHAISKEHSEQFLFGIKAEIVQSDPVQMRKKCSSKRAKATDHREASLWASNDGWAWRQMSQTVKDRFSMISVACIGSPMTSLATDDPMKQSFPSKNNLFL